MPKIRPPTSRKLDELRNWITPEQFVEEFPALATIEAIHKDIWRRKVLGLEECGAVRQVGRKFLVHRVKYGEWRIEQHKPPTE